MQNMSASKLPLVIKTITQQHLPYADTSILEIHTCFSKNYINHEIELNSLLESIAVLIKENFFLHPSARTRKGLNPVSLGYSLLKLVSALKNRGMSFLKNKCPACPERDTHLTGGGRQLSSQQDSPSLWRGWCWVPPYITSELHY